ncbi:MAG: type II toxin-antitoxin system VapB family antitoxin [Deltaproteobacteria bacterium]|jgi:Arc/MetJ family transcription regulator|nr:type II toxin-antitoxin system VapB family antitoxin [Deltaproteobacteria bacterium]
MRTDIIIDDEIMWDAMENSGIRTKKGVVEQAMREFIARHARKDLALCPSGLCFCPSL